MNAFLHCIRKYSYYFETKSICSKLCIILSENLTILLFTFPSYPSPASGLPVLCSTPYCQLLPAVLIQPSPSPGHESGRPESLSSLHFLSWGIPAFITDVITSLNISADTVFAQPFSQSWDYIDPSCIQSLQIRFPFDNFLGPQRQPPAEWDLAWGRRVWHSCSGIHLICTAQEGR